MQPAEAVPEKPQKKYSVRPARDLNSKHERMLAKRKVDAEEAARVQQWKDEHLREMVRRVAFFAHSVWNSIALYTGFLFS